MSLSFSASIGQEDKKELFLDVMGKLSQQLYTLNITAPTLSFTSQVVPEDGGLTASFSIGGFTTPSSSSAANE